MALAVWRISSLLVNEDGPWDTFRKIRKAVHAGEFSIAHMDGERLTQDEIGPVMLAAGSSEGFFSDLLSCVWCTSMWVSAGIVAAYLLWPLSIWLLLIPALSAAAIMVNQWLTRT